MLMLQTLGQSQKSYWRDARKLQRWKRIKPQSKWIILDNITVILHRKKASFNTNLTKKKPWMLFNNVVFTVVWLWWHRGKKWQTAFICTSLSWTFPSQVCRLGTFYFLFWHWRTKASFKTSVWSVNGGTTQRTVKRTTSFFCGKKCCFKWKHRLLFSWLYCISANRFP